MRYQATHGRHAPSPTHRQIRSVPGLPLRPVAQGVAHSRPCTHPKADPSARVGEAQGSRPGARTSHLPLPCLRCCAACAARSSRTSATSTVCSRALPRRTRRVAVSALTPSGMTHASAITDRMHSCAAAASACCPLSSPGRRFACIGGGAAQGRDPCAIYVPARSSPIPHHRSSACKRRQAWARQL
jgi:hypothetical protein